MVVTIPTFNQQQKVEQNKVSNQLLGTLSIIIPKSITAPIELIKIRLQCMNSMIKNGTIDVPYKGIVDCAKRVVQEQGFLALWKGNATNILRFILLKKLNLFFKGSFNEIFTKNANKDEYWKSVFGNFLSGGLSGGTISVFSYPLQYAKTRLINDLANQKTGKPKQFNGLMDVFQKTFASDGFQGLYRGFVISFSGIFIYRALYFGLYNSIKPRNDTDYFFKFLAGYFATVVAGVGSYPLDTIRRRMMMSSCQKIMYTSSIDCAKDIYRMEGIQSFFKGALTNIVHGISGAILLMIYDSYNNSSANGTSQ